ncbi:MAG: ribbon-helix-helix protein, CopG family [Thermofilaceae archaeon]
MGRRSVLLQVKVPESVVAALDRLVEAGIFRSRSEAVAEGIRRVLSAYSVLGEGLALIEGYVAGRVEKSLGPGSLVEVDVEEARRRIAAFFGTDDVSEVLRRLRVRL